MAIWLFGLSPNVVSLSLASFFNSISSEMVSVVLPIYMNAQMKASNTSIGMIEGMSVILSCLIKLSAGAVVDNLECYKLFTALGYLFAAIARPSLLFSKAQIISSVYLLIISRWMDKIGKGLRGAPRDALLSSSIHPSYRGWSYSVHHVAQTLGATVSLCLALALILFHGTHTDASSGVDTMYETILFASIPFGFIATLIIAVCTQQRDVAIQSMLEYDLLQKAAQTNKDQEADKLAATTQDNEILALKDSAIVMVGGQRVDFPINVNSSAIFAKPSTYQDSLAPIASVPITATASISSNPDSKIKKNDKTIHKTPSKNTETHSDSETDDESGNDASHPSHPPSFTYQLISPTRSHHTPSQLPLTSCVSNHNVPFPALPHDLPTLSYTNNFSPIQQNINDTQPFSSAITPNAHSHLSTPIVIDPTLLNLDIPAINHSNFLSFFLNQVFPSSSTSEVPPHLSTIPSTTSLKDTPTPQSSNIPIDPTLTSVQLTPQPSASQHQLPRPYTVEQLKDIHNLVCTCPHLQPAIQQVSDRAHHADLQANDSFKAKLARLVEQHERKNNYNSSQSYQMPTTTCRNSNRVDIYHQDIPISAAPTVFSGYQYESTTSLTPIPENPRNLHKNSPTQGLTAFSPLFMTANNLNSPIRSDSSEYQPLLHHTDSIDSYTRQFKDHNPFLPDPNPSMEETPGWCGSFTPLSEHFATLFLTIKMAFYLSSRLLVRGIKHVYFPDMHPSSTREERRKQRQAHRLGKTLFHMLSAPNVTHDAGCIYAHRRAYHDKMYGGPRTELQSPTSTPAQCDSLLFSPPGTPLQDDHPVPYTHDHGHIHHQHSYNDQNKSHFLFHHPHELYHKIEDDYHTKADEKEKARIARSLLHSLIILLCFGQVFTVPHTFLILLAHHQNISLKGIVIITLLYNLVYSLVTTPAGVLSDKLRRRTTHGGVFTVCIGWFVRSLIFIYLAMNLFDPTAASSTVLQPSQADDGPIHLTATTTTITIAYIAYGCYMGFTEGTIKAFLADTIFYSAPQLDERHKRRKKKHKADKNTANTTLVGLVFGIFDAMVGLSELIASILAGIFFDRQAIVHWLWFNSFGSVIAAIFLLLWRRHVVNQHVMRANGPLEYGLDDGSAVQGLLQDNSTPIHGLFFDFTKQAHATQRVHRFPQAHEDDSLGTDLNSNSITHESDEYMVITHSEKTMLVPVCIILEEDSSVMNKMNIPFGSSTSPPQCPRMVYRAVVQTLSIPEKILFQQLGRIPLKSDLHELERSSYLLANQFNQLYNVLITSMTSKRDILATMVLLQRILDPATFLQHPTILCFQDEFSSAHHPLFNVVMVGEDRHTLERRHLQANRPGVLRVRDAHAANKHHRKR